MSQVQSIFEPKYINKYPIKLSTFFQIPRHLSACHMPSAFYLEHKRVLFLFYHGQTLYQVDGCCNFVECEWQENVDSYYSYHTTSSKGNFQIHKSLSSALQVISTDGCHMKDEVELQRPNPPLLLSHKSKIALWCIKVSKKQPIWDCDLKLKMSMTDENRLNFL